MLNPVGFLAEADRPSVALSTLDPRGGPSEAMVVALRSCVGVEVDVWDDEALEVVAGLAMAGVPLTGEPPSAASGRLGPEVTAALAAPVDLGDPIAREEHSLVQRRAALDAFARGAAGPGPAVSIVVATRRPEMLDFALRQVGKQRGGHPVELVLAPHGFEPDPQAVRDRLGSGVPVRIVQCPPSMIFGDVLQSAADAADGDVVLKMDDDDWYAADAVADLLRARRYSGADLVGMPPEFHYLAERALTVKRGHPSERFARFVAGGTILVDRTLLRDVGGFRAVRRSVDSQLLAAVAAVGGAIYRTHGLGYLLRRNPTGHTWEVDLDYLLDPARVQQTWPGFHPSRLLEIDPLDRP